MQITYGMSDFNVILSSSFYFIGNIIFNIPVAFYIKKLGLRNSNMVFGVITVTAAFLHILINFHIVFVFLG